MNSKIRVTLFLSIILMMFISWKHLPLKASENDYTHVLKTVDLHLGGMISGVSWNIHLENFEDEKFKNEVYLYVEAASVSNQRFALVTFLEPKKFEGQKLLIRANNMWFIKKGLNQPLAISGRQRLSGSAANADVASTTYSIDYNINEVKMEKFGNDNCYVFTLEAKNSLVSYSKVKLWVTKTENTALKAEYYAKSSNKIIKQALFEYNNSVSYNDAKLSFASKITIFDQVDVSNKTILNVSTIRFPSFENSKFDKNNL